MSDGIHRPQPRRVAATLHDYIVIDGLTFRIEPEGRGYRLIHVQANPINMEPINRTDR